MNALAEESGESFKETDPFPGALAKVSLLSERIWWSREDYTDPYRLANLSLVGDLLVGFGGGGEEVQPRRPAAPPPPPLPVDPNALRDFRDRHPLEGGSSEMTDSLPARDGPDWEGGKWLLTHRWPSAILETYPSVPAVLASPSDGSLFTRDLIAELLRREHGVPYSVESADEDCLHRRISSETVRHLWSSDGPAGRRRPNLLERVKEAEEAEEARRNEGRVPAFYPSVERRSNSHCYPTPVMDARYQCELFPYHDVKQRTWNQVVKEGIQGGKKQGEVAPRGLEASSGAFPCRPAGAESGWAAAAAARTGGSLLGAFPADPSAAGVQTRPHPRPHANLGLSLDALRPLKAQAEPADLDWLLAAYPKRAREFLALNRLGRGLDELYSRLKGERSGEEQAGGGGGGGGAAEGRRLYRDVVVAKDQSSGGGGNLGQGSRPGGEEGEQDPGGRSLEGVFDELEREALEQYRPSRTCLLNPPVPDSLASQEEEELFKNLEREALEQYQNNDEDLLSAQSEEGSSTGLKDEEEEALRSAAGSDEAAAAPDKAVTSPAAVERCSNEEPDTADEVYNNAIEVPVGEIEVFIKEEEGP